MECTYSRFHNHKTFPLKWFTSRSIKPKMRGQCESSTFGDLNIKLSICLQTVITVHFFNGNFRGGQ